MGQGKKGGPLGAKCKEKYSLLPSSHFGHGPCYVTESPRRQGQPSRTGSASRDASGSCARITTKYEPSFGTRQVLTASQMSGKGIPATWSGSTRCIIVRRVLPPQPGKVASCSGNTMLRPLPEASRPGAERPRRILSRILPITEHSVAPWRISTSAIGACQVCPQASELSDLVFSFCLFPPGSRCHA